jgi:hypothetical protein
MSEFQLLLVKSFLVSVLLLLSRLVSPSRSLLIAVIALSLFSVVFETMEYQGVLGRRSFEVPFYYRIGVTWMAAMTTILMDYLYRWRSVGPEILAHHYSNRSDTSAISSRRNWNPALKNVLTSITHFLIFFGAVHVWAVLLYMGMVFLS